MRRIVLASLALLSFAAPAPGAAITGFADQGIGRPQDGGDGWGANAHALAAALAGRVAQARYQLAWDYAWLPADDWRVADFDNWLATVERLGLRPLVAFSASGPNPPPETYERAVRAFRATHPQIGEFSPWNEPNNRTTYAPPARAAAYLKALTDACAGACTIAAADVAGTRTPGTYYEDYARAVAALGLRPAIWAYHPYDVINNVTPDRLDGIVRFWSAVNAASPGVEVWFTEVGAFKCIHGIDYGPGGQEESARRLNELMADPVYGKATRVYYYHLANGADCNWDTGLLDSTAGDGAPRPALRTLFPPFTPSSPLLAPSPLVAGFGAATAQASIDDMSG